MIIKNLVLSGGSIKGISFLGTIKLFEEYNIINNLESVSGTSIGSFIATLICLKYTYSELKPIFMKLNFENLQDVNSTDILNFFYDYGIDSGENFLRIIEILIKAKTDNSKITFKELFDLTKIKLIITATCVNNKKIIYYDYENTPNDMVSLSIRKSVSIPLLFKPVIDNDKYFVDGALINNFPIEIYDNDIKNTLGIIISEEEDNFTDINSFELYLLSLIECTYKDALSKLLTKYHKNIVVIRTDIHFLNFFISHEQKEELINLGYNLTKKYITDNFVEIFDYGDLILEKFRKESMCSYNFKFNNYKLCNIDNIPILKESDSHEVFGIKYLLHKNIMETMPDKIVKEHIEYFLKEINNLFIYMVKVNDIELKD